MLSPAKFNSSLTLERAVLITQELRFVPDYEASLSALLNTHIFSPQVEFIGSIELVYGSEHEFVSLERELQPPGALTQPTTSFPFDFSAVEKAHESYNGMNVTLRYFLRVTISRSLAPNITQELDIWVRSPAVAASAVTDFNPIKMEVYFLAHFLLFGFIVEDYSGWH